MGNSLADLPNLSFETEDTIKMNSSIILSPGVNGPSFGVIDQYYDHNMLFAPPPAVHTNSTPSSFSLNLPPSTFQGSNAPFLSAAQPPVQELYMGHDYSLPNSSYYSIFLNSQAATLVNSLHNDGFKPEPDVLNSADLMYNLNDFELNPSLDLIPDTMYGTEVLGGSAVDMPQFSPQISSGLPNSSSAYELGHFPQEVSTPHKLQYAPITIDEFRPPPAILLKNMPFSSSSPNLGVHKVTKKPSLSRINSVKKNKINTNLDTSSPQQQRIGNSPLCNKYKAVDVFQQSPSSRSASIASSYSSGSHDSPMPSMNTFRHNTEIAYLPYYDTPQRKTLVVLDLTKAKQQLQIQHQIQHQMHFQLFQQQSPMRRLSDDQSNKPKKYTRRRLLPRSKNGCWICRIKHLKCDEKRPVCLSCSKFGIECDYSPTKPDYVVDKQLRKEKLLAISMLRKQKLVTKKISTRLLRNDDQPRLQNIMRE